MRYFPVRLKYLWTLGSAIASLASLPAAHGQLFDKKLPTAQVLARARTTSSSVTDWVYQYDGSMVRADLDLVAAQILVTDPDARAAMGDALAGLTSVIDAQEWNLDASAQRSSKTIDPKNPLRQIVQEAAVAHGFTPTAIDNIKVWRTIGSINAYTFSADPERLEVVVFQDLIDLMTASELRATLAHELGHVHMKHVLTGLVFQAIYDASGRNLIPDDQKDAFLALVEMKSKALYKKAIDFDGPVADTLVAPLNELAKHVGEKLVARVGKDGLAKLVSKVNTALGGQGVKFPADGSDSDPLKAKEFTKLMTNLTRSQETTADRWAMLTAGPHDLASAMSKLAAGRPGNADALLQQANEMLDRAARMHFDLTQIENADHPQTVFRVASALSYTKTDNYKIMTNPFLKSLDMYVKLIQSLGSDRDSINGNKIELVKSDQLTIGDSELSKYAQELSNALRTEILQEVADVQAGHEHPRKIQDLLQYLDKLGYSLSSIKGLFANDSLFGKLYVDLRAKPDSSVAQAFLTELQDRVPATPTNKSVSAILNAAPPLTKARQCQTLFSNGH